MNPIILDWWCNLEESKRFKIIEEAYSMTTHFNPLDNEDNYGNENTEGE